MTYRNKLLLRRLGLILAVAAAVILLALLVGFTYLGRYVVYTEDGAAFSFLMEEASETSAAQVSPVPEITLVTGEPIPAEDVIGDVALALRDSEVQGVLVDYASLSGTGTIGQIELGEDANNTLALELRVADRDLLSNEKVSRMISRARNQNVWLIAVISCLSDSEYALQHQEQVVKISGGAYWLSPGGSYWLDPANETVLSNLADTILQLSKMGFNEVVLSDFYLPTSSDVVYDLGGRTAEDIMASSYTTLLEATSEACKLGILITDPASGHQLQDTAERLYVYYSNGATVRDYASLHQSQYLVFVTGSHDTRFDGYGKLTADEDLVGEAGIEPLPEEASEEEQDALEDEEPSDEDWSEEWNEEWNEEYDPYAEPEW